MWQFVTDREKREPVAATNNTSLFSVNVLLSFVMKTMYISFLNKSAKIPMHKYVHRRRKKKLWIICLYWNKWTSWNWIICYTQYQITNKQKNHNEQMNTVWPLKSIDLKRWTISYLDNDCLPLFIHMNAITSNRNHAILYAQPHTHIDTLFSYALKQENIW